jgi:hypothetical protein
MKKHATKFVPVATEGLGKLLDSIAKRTATLSTEIQKLCVSAVYHSIVNRNVDFATTLYARLPGEFRRNCIIAFMEKHGNCAWSKDGKKFLFFETDKKWSDEYAATLLAMPWGKAAPEPEAISMYDVRDEVTKMLGRIAKQVKSLSGKDVPIEHADLINALNLTVASYSKAQADLLDGAVATVPMAKAA